LRKAAELFSRLNESVERGAALAVLGQLMALSGEAAAQILTEARQLLESSTDKRRLGTCAIGFGILHTVAGLYAEARREHELAQALFTAAGAERLATAALDNAANMMWAEGALDLAIETVRKVLTRARQVGDRRFIGHASGNLAGMLTARGDLEEALIVAHEAMPLCREDEHSDWLFLHLALRAAKVGRSEEAAQLWGYAERIAGNGTVWQVNEERAARTLATLLGEVLTSAHMEQLRGRGRHLDESQAIALALA
jgi:tetratricopeptide (TPR) repeat protein